MGSTDDNETPFLRAVPDEGEERPRAHEVDVRKLYLAGPATRKEADQIVRDLLDRDGALDPDRSPRRHLRAVRGDDP